MMNLVKNFLREEEGASAVEYGVLVALIIAACVAIISTLGQTIRNTFSQAAVAVVA